MTDTLYLRTGNVGTWSGTDWAPLKISDFGPTAFPWRGYPAGSFLVNSEYRWSSCAHVAHENSRPILLGSIARTSRGRRALCALSLRMLRMCTTWSCVCYVCSSGSTTNARKYTSARRGIFSRDPYVRVTNWYYTRLSSRLSMSDVVNQRPVLFSLIFFLL